MKTQWLHPISIQNIHILRTQEPHVSGDEDGTVRGSECEHFYNDCDHRTVFSVITGLVSHGKFFELHFSTFNLKKKNTKRLIPQTHIVFVKDTHSGLSKV